MTVSHLTRVTPPDVAYVANRKLWKSLTALPSKCHSSGTQQPWRRRGLVLRIVTACRELKARLLVIYGVCLHEFAYTGAMPIGLDGGLVSKSAR